jgi:hypothetical protein
LVLACEAKTNLHPLAFTQRNLRHQAFFLTKKVPAAAKKFAINGVEQALPSGLR